jgi:hypothetical protein
MLPIHDRVLVDDHIADLRRVAASERLARIAARSHRPADTDGQPRPSAVGPASPGRVDGAGPTELVAAGRRTR